MREISSLSFAVNTYTPLLARLKSGPLLKEILTNFREKSNGNLKPNRNLFIYSAHDTTVANILNTLGVFKNLGYHNPPYTATVLFELYESNLVKVFYKNSSEPILLDLPNCGKFCSLDKMFEIYQNVMPNDWEEECALSILQMPLDTVNINESLSRLMIFTFVSFMSLVGIFVLVIATINKQRKDYLSEEKWSALDDDWS